MKSSFPILSINLLPPEKLYCNFNYWSSMFSQDMQILWDRAHGVPLEKLPKGVSDMIFPYLLLVGKMIIGKIDLEKQVHLLLVMI